MNVKFNPLSGKFEFVWQAPLQSGVNIKTINGQTLLGSGNVDLETSSGVTSFNARTGVVTLASSDVTAALGFTPYNATNPNSYTSNAGTVTSVVAGTGLTGGTITASGTLALATSGVTAGTYPKVTVDAYGRVTAGAGLVAGDIPTLNQSTTGNAATATALQTARTIGGVSFNGTTNINLPGVNVAGNQNTTGSAALLSIPDTRAVADEPQGKTPRSLAVDFKNNTAVNSPPVTANATYSHILTMAGWDTNGASGGWPSQLSIADGIAIRQATSATAWGAWRTVLHSNNFNSYAPTLTGTGASGSWGISITGSAATLTTARSINGTTFNGSANITTANWGAARTLTIGNAGKTVNGSGDVTWTVGEIGAEFQQPQNVPRNNLGDPTVREMAIIDGQFDNKIERHDIANIFVETSTDNVTWTPFAITDAQKRILVGGDTSQSTLAIPYGTPYFRIRMRATSYVSLNAFYSYWSANGHSTTVKIFRKHDLDANWTVVANSAATVSSWPGHLYLPHTGIWWRLTATQGSHNHEVYVVFQPVWNATYPSNPINLYKVQWWGGYPAGRRNLYGTSELGEASFPAALSAVGAITQNGSQVLHAGNYTSYSPSLTGTGASGSWGISVTGSSASTTGNAATATVLQTARTINGVSFNGSANITVADATKLPLAGGTMTGAIAFAAGQTWPTFNQNTTGTASNVTGTVAIANGGTGATTAAAALTALGAYAASNPSGYITSSGSITGNAATVTNGVYVTGDQQITGIKNFLVTTNSSIATATTNLANLEVRSPGTGVGSGAAFMQFHRPAAYAGYFGIDTDNVWKVGGWSVGANAYPILHSNSFNSYAPTLTGVGASGTWGISVTGNAATVTSITSGQVTTALGFTPYNATNPSSFITTAGARSALSFTAGSGAYNGTTGVITIPTNTTHLTNGSGYITGITSGNVTTALGYTPLSTGGGTITTSGSSQSLTITDTGINGANLRLIGNGATTPEKTIRVQNGNFEVINSDYSSYCINVTDSGNFTAQGTVRSVSGGFIFPDGTTQTTAATGGGGGGTGDVTLAGVQTLTNKTIAFADNTLTDVASVTATQTLTNKTVEKLVLNDGYTEEVFVITDGATVELDPNNGSIQTWTLGANRTPSQVNWAAGQSITLMVDDGTARTITWTTLAPVWETNGGNAPTLSLTGFTVITLWKVGTTIYGARVGDA